MIFYIRRAEDRATALDGYFDSGLTDSRFRAIEFIARDLLCNFPSQDAVINYKNILTSIIYDRDCISDYDWMVEVDQLAIDQQ